MVTRVLHVSDLHFGAGDDEAIERGAPVLIERFAPELVIASGDLSHRGREDQLVRASRFLHGLDRPVLAIPGNHDIPYTFPARFTRSFQEFERQWETTEPTYSSPTLHVIGLNSVRPWRHQSGGVRTAQLERAEERLRDAAPGAFQIVVLHHHMIGAPWRSRKKPVARRNHVLASLVAAGADLVVAGHIHQAAVSERREFEISHGAERGVVVSIAPGLGQPRPKRQGEARGVHIYEVEESCLRIQTYVWRDTDWGLTAERQFPRGREPLERETV
ncbi:MAG: metallophosphoesterase [Actinobacteria bacterium]|jgi:3',5'-cyclic AMP phosphodiesterase CpdA|nr:MAG: metallophosphoesterase [Actinomycetota bacterium]